MFQVSKSVKVVNPDLEHHGQAGHVVHAVDPYDRESLVSVKMDTDGEEYEFKQSDLQVL